MGQPIAPEWTREELHRFAMQRLTEDMHPVDVWGPGEHERELVLASGRELPHEESAPREAWDPQAWRKANPRKWRNARLWLGLDASAGP